MEERKFAAVVLVDAGLFVLILDGLTGHACELQCKTSYECLPAFGAGSRDRISSGPRNARPSKENGRIGASSSER
jgi:hypothetical protein